MINQKSREDVSVKFIVDLINELKELDEIEAAEWFHLPSSDVAYHRKIDFDNWLRRCVRPDRRFASLDEAWGVYEKSFG